MPDADWVTFDTPQTRSALAGQRVRFVRDVNPRDLGAILANVGPALQLLRRRRYAHVVASGNVALSFLPIAPALGIGAHFFESITRTAGPSLTGRLLEPVPRVRLYTQVEGWDRGRWRSSGSVFDGFEAVTLGAAPPVRRVVVTLGMNTYGFRRLVERLVAVLPEGADVLWQTGVTDVTGLPIRASALVPEHELVAAMRDADVVVAHAGAGSALAALGAGHRPLLVPRRAGRGEQVDDHQLLLAGELERHGLALIRDADELTREDLERAAAARARRRAAPPPIELA
jgi:UDP-N-acetylglucosamine transferase subunit ALG13